MAATQLLPWHSEMDFLAHDDGILALAALAQRVEDLEPAGSNKQIVAASMRAPRLSRHLARLGRHDQRCRRSHGGLERQQDRGNLSLLGGINAISTIDAIAAHEAIDVIAWPAMAAKPLWLRALAGLRKPLAPWRPSMPS